MTEPVNKPLPPQWIGGKPVTESAEQPFDFQPPPGYYLSRKVDPQRHKGLAIAALVLGIGALVFSFTLNILAFPALGAAITGLILGCVAYRDQGMAKWAVWVNVLAIGASLYDVVAFIHALQRITNTA